MCTEKYLPKIKQIAQLINDAEYVLIGGGAGLSASAGIDYTNKALFAQWFPELARKGLSTIGEGVGSHWEQTDSNRTAYWAFWANQMYRICNAPVGNPYLQLYELVKEKNYFVVTTNADGQFRKAAFDENRLYTPQGDYRYLQCKKPCCEELFEGSGMVNNMLENMDKDTFLIRKQDIPHCPYCGGVLETNLRKDSHFAEEQHMSKQSAYENFIQNSIGKSLVLMELGVGFNTPDIIRFPFEELTCQHNNARLIRLNQGQSQVTEKLQEKAICLNTDIGLVLNLLVSHFKENN